MVFIEYACLVIGAVELTKLVFLQNYLDGLMSAFFIIAFLYLRIRRQFSI
jgi:hypothetical protein